MAKLRSEPCTCTPSPRTNTDSPVQAMEEILNDARLPVHTKEEWDIIIPATVGDAEDDDQIAYYMAPFLGPLTCMDAEVNRINPSSIAGFAMPPFQSTRGRIAPALVMVATKDDKNNFAPTSDPRTPSTTATFRLTRGRILPTLAMTTSTDDKKDSKPFLATTTRPTEATALLNSHTVKHDTKDNVGAGYRSTSLT
jgi:hypothetical protein